MMAGEQIGSALVLCQRAPLPAGDDVPLAVLYVALLLALMMCADKLSGGGQ